MISSLILVVMMIGLLSILAQSLSVVYSSFSEVNSVAKEMMLEKLWQDAITRNLVQPSAGNQYIAPIGSDLLGEDMVIYGHGFPAGIGAPLKNAKNIPIHYCALSSDLPITPNRTITLGSGVGYEVETLNLNGREYILKSSQIENLQLNSPNVVALIISPKSPGGDASCSKVRYDAETGIYQIPGMTAKVIPIIAPHVFN